MSLCKWQIDYKIGWCFFMSCWFTFDSVLKNSNNLKFKIAFNTSLEKEVLSLCEFSKTILVDNSYFFLAFFK